MVNRLVSSQSRNLGLTHNHSLRAPSTVRSTEKSVKADLHPHVCKILYRPEITHAIKSSRPIFQHSAKKHSDWYFFDLRAAHAEDVECQFIRYDFCFKSRPAKNAAITRDVMKAENFPNRKSSAQIPSPEPTNLPKPHKTQWNRWLTLQQLRCNSNVLPFFVVWKPSKSQPAQGSVCCFALMGLFLSPRFRSGTFVLDFMRNIFSGANLNTTELCLNRKFPICFCS